MTTADQPRRCSGCGVPLPAEDGGRCVFCRGEATEWRAPMVGNQAELSGGQA